MVKNFVILLFTFFSFSSLVYALDDKIDSEEENVSQKEQVEYTTYQEIDKEKVNPPVHGELGSPYSPASYYIRHYSYYNPDYGYRYGYYY